MTYPDMTHWQRKRAARQFHLMRMALEHHRKKEAEEPDPPQYVKAFRIARRLAVHEELHAVRTMLHALFD